VLGIILKVGIKSTMGFESDHGCEIKLSSFKSLLSTAAMGAMRQYRGSRQKRREKQRKNKKT
tara:strand:+ start:334 stop:519 length:186 start_codon:yes stop_codon:yes gene_type:complete